MQKRELITAIQRLKKEKNAVILAHFYVNPEVQDIADYIGDSLGLSHAAAKTEADIILFCGVNFMAETTSIISPGKKVLVPDNSAGCSLADSIEREELIEWKNNNPDGVVVSYVNTTAEIKAYSDICCTSSNALKVVMSIPMEKKILFVPDKNLGNFIRIKTGRDIEIWEGDCCVHNRFDTKMVIDKSLEYPDADILIHPESKCSNDLAIHNMHQAYFYSTSGMIKHVNISPKNQFIIVTEAGVIHEMLKNNPGKEFIPIQTNALCRNMKKVTLEKVLHSLQTEQFEIKVPKEMREKAWLPIKRMLGIV
ncbi:MAG: quinolinate synthase NadA [Rikenellaceae bacterium]